MAVSGLTGTLAVSASFYSSCALLSNSTMRCWGTLESPGPFGLSLSPVHATLTPKVVPGLTGVVTMVTLSTAICAVLASGSVKCWGENAQRDLGTRAARRLPSPRPSLD